MPHFTNDNILVVTYEELVPSFYKTMVSLSNVVSRDMKRGYGMERVVRGHLGSGSLIKYDSLPKFIKSEITDPRKGLHVMEPYFALDKEAVEFYMRWRFGDGSSIEEEVQAKYIANASVLNTLFRTKDARINEILSKNSRPKKLWQGLCSELILFKPILKQKYEMECDLPENYRRLQETAEQYQASGYEYLISGRHLNTNRQKVCKDTLKLLENLFAGQSYKPNATDVSNAYDAFIDGYSEVINNETGELYDPKDFKKLSKSTIYDYLTNWESKLATHALRSGDRQKLMQNFKPYHSLDIPKYAGSIISVDDRQPPFEWDDSKRVWFYLGQDGASAAITTWVYGKTKEGLILDFYRQMIRNYSEWNLALPHEIEAEAALNSSFKTTFLQPGKMFQEVRIEANNARGKFIESRFNRQIRYQDEKKDNEWIGRPFAKDESNQPGKVATKKLPYDDIVVKSLHHLQDWNNSPHAVETEKTRWEYFVENQHPGLKPTNYRGIIPYLGYKTKTSCNVGMVKLQGKEFLLGDHDKICTGEDLIKLMKMVEGEQLDVYWLDGNDGQVLKAYAYIGDKYMCEILPKPHYARAKIEQTEADLEARTLMSSYVATVEGFSNSRRKEIDKVTVIDNRPATLNNKFQIRELMQHLNVEERSDASAAEPEILEANFQEDFNPVEIDAKNRFRETF